MEGNPVWSATYSCVEAVGSEDENCLTTGLGAEIAMIIHHAYSLIAICKLKHEGTGALPRRRAKIRGPITRFA